MNDLKHYSFPKYGASLEGDNIRFRFVSQSGNCGIVIYDLATGIEMERIAFDEAERFGFVYEKVVKSTILDQKSYAFYSDDKIIADTNALAYADHWEFGTAKAKSTLKAIVPYNHFNWGKEKAPELPFSDVVCYCLHTRGFTVHPSSGVKTPGTFHGIQEKISYLKNIGITAIELQPSYEFLELPEPEKEVKVPHSLAKAQEKVNYWGYTEGCYYAPKGNYSSGDAVNEFKSLVKELHTKGMELYMQFYFPETFATAQILSVLTFWVKEYHVDGFRLMGSRIPIEMITKEPSLGNTKLFYYRFEDTAIPSWKPSNLCESNDDYCLDMRRFLKGDEGLLNTVLYHMRHGGADRGQLHYLSNYAGFTLADMVSYDYKHNELNEEENRDGTDYNCSWNCGEEGPTKSRRIQALRLQQIKNAYSLLLLGHSAPMIFMGDEFGNSQEGNNNPYCQDNEITWLDWKLQKKNAKQLQFWKELIAFRKMHTIYHSSKELLLMDTKASGYPDLSYHGESAWKLDQEHYVRHFGMMFSEAYAEVAPANSFLYVGVNMHWDKHTLALPRLPKDMAWKCVLTTADFKDVEMGEEDTTFFCPARSICVFESVVIPKEATKKRKASSKKQDE